MTHNHNESRQSEKLGAPVSFRVHPDVKKQFDSLPKEFRIRAYERMRIEVARAIHESKFLPFNILYPNPNDEK